MAVLSRSARFILAAALLALSSAPTLAVFGGKPVHDSEPLAKSVAAILYHDGSGAHLCTAVLLGPKLLLTAAHCTEGNRAAIKVIFGTTLHDIGDDRLRTVAAIARAGKTSAGKGKYAYQDPDDLALVVLGSPAPSGSRPTGRAGSAPSPAAVTIAGYGATSELRNPNDAGQRRLGFDGILRTVSVPIAGADSVLLVGNQGQGTGACTGDSGAPAFADGHLVGILVGVSSPRASNDYCRGTAWFANLGRWRDWIETTARDLGQPLN